MPNLIPGSLLGAAAVAGLVACQKLMGRNRHKTPSTAGGSTGPLQGSTVPQPDGKVLAETFVTPGKGVVGVVLDEAGRPVVVTHDGRVLQACRLPGDKSPSDLPECKTLVDTTVQAVLPITVLRHTGSQCMAFIMSIDGQQVVFEYCW